MSFKKYLLNFVQGWFPQDYALEKSRQTATSLLRKHPLAFGYGIGMGVPEGVHWTLYFLGAYKNQETAFFITQMVIITLFVALIVLGYWLNKKIKRTQAGIPLHNPSITNKGWFPKESGIAYAHKHKSLKPRWKKPLWIAFTLVVVVALVFFACRGVQTLIYYSDPQADITSAYFGKSLNCSTVNVGDVVEVQVSVYWHGHVFPEFKRQVEIVDSYPEGNFELVSGSNTVQYSGYGGSNQFRYLLKVIGNDTSAIELPKPRLYLDNIEIPLYSQSQSFEVYMER